MESQVFDDVVMWLSIASVGAICLLMLYYGINGIANFTSLHKGAMNQAFAIAGYILFLLLPLLIFSLVIDTTVISEVLELGMPLLYISIIADILLMTLLYLIM